MLEAILLEIELQREYLKEDALDSIYFGGGTPSLLDTKDLVRIFDKIYQYHTLKNDAEITLEANPDDLTPQKLFEFKQDTPVNRLSIGIQSFSNDDLVWMNRAHNASHAHECLKLALNAGFEDLTIDLIYGAPTTSNAQWVENLRITFEYQIPHISCYCLTVEDKTALGSFVKRGIQPPVDEERAAHQFEYLIQAATEHGYEQYEISNFAKPDRCARHNSNYWRGAPYLGIGPAAHSFDGRSRQWNIANNSLYIRSLSANKIPFEQEVLTLEQRYNEYIMTALRTMWGVDEHQLSGFGKELEAHFHRSIAPFLINGKVEKTGRSYRLTLSGKLLADRISMELFVS
jgi:oxygen-independent coproporphyrinogen-3 oxidase